jgi:hypothetical protein
MFIELAILLPTAIERLIERVTEMPIQIVYLAIGYVIAMDMLAAIAYYVRRKIRRKFIGKTALFYCYDVNPRIGFRAGLTSKDNSSGEIIPIWLVLKKKIM